MNALQQFLALLSEKTGDNEELKTALTDSFKAVQTAFDTQKDRADKLGLKADELAKLNKTISSKLGIEEVNEESISEAITKLSKSKDEGIEALKTKHEAELAKVRDSFGSELKAKEASLNELNSKYNDNLFKTSIIDGGLLDGFVDEPMARELIVNKLKSQLIFEDGKIFVNDGSGEKSKDNRTGEFLNPASVVENLKKTISPIYLNKETVTKGMKIPVNQPSGRSADSEIDTSKYRDSASFINDAMSQIKQ